MVVSSDGVGRVQGPPQRAGVDGGQRLAGQRLSHLLRLPQAALVEGDIVPSQGKVQAVGLRFAVADEEETHWLRPLTGASPSRPSGGRP